MGTRGRPREFDRDTALRRAMETFWELGYEGASMSELTAAMGVNSPSVYACFGSKEQLFREAIELYSSAEGGASFRALAEGRTTREAIEGLLRAAAATCTDPRTPPGCMLLLTAAGGVKSAELQGFLSECRGLMQTRIKERIDRGLAEGDLREGTDTRGLAAYFTTILHGLSIQARDGATRDDLDAAIDWAIAAFDSLAPPAAAVP